MSPFSPRIAIIVQQQIKSTSSGVAFSINPQNNCFDEAVVNANYGLGESVVAGQVVPDSFIVNKLTNSIMERKLGSKSISIWVDPLGSTSEKENREEEADKQCLNDEQVFRVVELAAKVEEHYNKPMDIEWAFEGLNLYLLQARPITAYLPLFPELITNPDEPKFLYLDIIASTQGFSDLMSPLGIDIWRILMFCIEDSMSSDTNNKDDMCFTCHGKMYINISILLEGFGPTMTTQTMKHHATIIGELSRSTLDEYTPKNRNKPIKLKTNYLQRFKDTAKKVGSIFYSYLYFDDCLNAYKAFSAKFLEIIRNLRNDIEKYSFEEIESKCKDGLKEISNYTFFIVSCMIAKYRLSRLFKPEDKAEDLLLQLQMDLPGNPTSQMGHLMCSLAAHPDLQETKSGEEFVKRLNSKDYSDDFLDMYNDYMMRFGCRCIREIEISTPRSFESPVAFFEQLKQIDLQKNATNTVKERRLKAYNNLLSMARKNWCETKFKIFEAMQREGWGYREDPKYLVVNLIDLLRRKALLLSDKWVKEGKLNSVDDIFNLSRDDIVKAESDPNFDFQSAIRNNLEPRKLVASVRRWPVLLDSRGKIIQPDRKELRDGEYGCEPISPGIVRGRANVLRSPYEKPLIEGDILVTHATDPGWTPIFLNAAGVVLEVGNSLQHGAIIAREYGLPCVSGMVDATEIIKDGQMIEIDGTKGTVCLL